MEAGREGERREADGRDARHKMTGGEGMVAVQGFWRLGDWMGNCDMEGQETERA